MQAVHTLFVRVKSVVRRHRAVLTAVAAVGAVVLLRTAAAHAGTDVTFDDLNLLLEGWTKGSLGKGLALMALIGGIGIAAVKQSFAALFAGIGVAAGASIGPGIISQVVTAIF